MADIFGTDDLSVKDNSHIGKGDTRRTYTNSCVKKYMEDGKTRDQAIALCKKGK